MRNNYLFSIGKSVLLICFLMFALLNANAQNRNFIIDENAPERIDEYFLGFKPSGGDTLFVASTRTRPLQFDQLEGDPNNPIVIINHAGQVHIQATNTGDWGALVFFNAKHIKVSGNGHPGYKYGFLLEANEAGISFAELSSDCEAEFVKISHDGFFGIVAKEDYNGNPPVPYPVFDGLSIHDCFIEGVSEGLYLGETKSPGMEFKHVKIYNNIIRNTLRESIQIANMVEDVEIRNNTLLNAGLEGLNFHRNNLQIGDNSVAKVHHNIMMGAPDYGIINFGKGDLHFTDNYIANNKGIFSDNRIFSDSIAPISMSDNYFKSLTGNEVIKNYNEINFLTVNDNTYDVAMNFYNDGTANNNESLSNNTLANIPEIQFEDITANNYALVASSAPEFIGMGAPGGPEFFDYDDPATTPRLLVVSPEMVMDSVYGGSVFSPLYLFDEQMVNPENNEHPISKSWKPDYTMNEASYHAVVDLGDEHFISEISLHDMHSTHEFVVEYYTGVDWNTLVVEPGEGFNVWKTHETAVETRFLRFSMYESPYAAINEVLIYGYPVVKEAQQIVVDASMISDQVIGGSVNSPNYLFDEQNIDFENKENPISESWKPFYNDTKAPYYVEIDLGSDHHISEIWLHDMHSTNDFVVQVGDGENWSDLIYENLDKFRTWKTHKTNTVARYLRLVMPGSPYAAVNEMVLRGYPVMSFPTKAIEEQIVVDASMVRDLVQGGSVDAPAYLFDEQQVDPFAGEHPISKSWKPYYNDIRAPYYVEVDLGSNYQLTKVLLHDMHNRNDFIIEYQANNTWLPLIVESGDAYNTWKTHEVSVITSKLRLAMMASPYASMNEILLYGYPSSYEVNKSHNTLSVSSIDKHLTPVTLYPNPVQDRMFMKGIDSNSQTNTIQILDILGKTIYQGELDYQGGGFQVPIDELQMAPGTYLLLYSNDRGQRESLKFVKN